MLASLTLLLYGRQLSTPALSADEVTVLRQSQFLVQTGRDAEGRLTPLFFHVNEERWLQPIPIYWTALVAVAAPAGMAGRLAAVVVGSINVALMFLLVQRLFGDLRVAIGAALLIMLTPAHFVYARTGVDAIYALPFVLVWLIGVVDFLSAARLRSVVGGAVVLGVGVYSQPSAPLTMGFLLTVGLAGLWTAGHRSARVFAGPVAAFTLPLGAVALWFAAYPQTYADTFGRWVIHAGHIRFPLDGLRAFVNWNTLATRVSLYWGFFDPSWLFFNGADATSSALHGASPFLFVTLILLVLGFSRRLQAGSVAVTLVLLAGLAVAPLAASTYGEPHAIGAALTVVPFAVVGAAGGLANWLGREGFAWRVLGWIAVGVAVTDFVRFYAAYLSA